MLYLCAPFAIQKWQKTHHKTASHLTALTLKEGSKVTGIQRWFLAFRYFIDPKWEISLHAATCFGQTYLKLSATFKFRLSIYLQLKLLTK